MHKLSLVGFLWLFIYLSIDLWFYLFVIDIIGSNVFVWFMFCKVRFVVFR